MAHKRWMATSRSIASSCFSIWHLLALLGYVCACLCKAPALPLAVLFPFAEVACAESALRALPMALLRHLAFLIAAAILVAPQLRIDTNMGAAPLIPLSAEDRLIRAGYAPLSYLVMLLFPAGISNHYDVPDEPLRVYPKLVVMACCTAVLIVIAAFALIFTTSGSGCRCFATVWLAFLAALSPSLGLFGNHVNTMTADRYVYLALILPFTTSPLTKALSGRIMTNRFLQFVLSCGLVAIVAILLFWSREEVGFWKNEYAFWGHAISVRDQANFRVYLGLNYLFANNLTPAKKHLEHAVELVQTKPMLRWDPQYGTSAGNDPVTVATAFHNLALIYGSEGELEKAENSYRSAIGTMPREPWYYIWYADFLTKVHREDDALNVVGDLMRTVRVQRWGDAKKSVRRIPAYLKRLAHTMIQERGAHGHALWVDGQAAVWTGWWESKLIRYP
eukprot:gnl/MRDRNA2_/MRDRNA2_170678_c0_seq1.p1 gnl/MRDRNA2_/MRDRNA2_170678_c0~~gnl/MRDRNA2_/MRDRNA2_170678_c0_seq1.p1  ORF type:complete len:464 (+),score=49.84 gnl/MRDRNA2_/MRDRNA2_170678_c0_seq1:49-1392(+)